METNNTSIFIDKILSSVEDEKIVSIRLMDNKKGEKNLKQIIIKPIHLKSGYHLQFVLRYITKDITKNYLPKRAIEEVKAFLQSFYQAELQTFSHSLYLSKTSAGQWKLKTKESKITTDINLSHNKQKQRSIAKNSPYLFPLGISNQTGDIKSSMYSKYKQINKFIEIISALVDVKDLSKPFEIVDMGCGKAYLSFALYDYLSTEKSADNISLIGVELRKELVEKSNEIAKQCEYSKLKFVEGYIDSFELPETDMLIALHACDTATDDAIYKGIKANAKYIVCSPCCHKQIRKEMNTSEGLSSLTDHGILKERQAEIITDTIRALILEAHGYKTKVMEFISSEHTSKNLLIVAVKKNEIDKSYDDKMAEIQILKKLFGIEKHYLETLIH